MVLMIAALCWIGAMNLAFSIIGNFALSIICCPSSNKVGQLSV